jgi:hypothetical protein
VSLSFDFIEPVIQLHVACYMRDETKKIKKNRENKRFLLHDIFHYNNKK